MMKIYAKWVFANEWILSLIIILWAHTWRRLYYLWCLLLQVLRQQSISILFYLVCMYQLSLWVVVTGLHSVVPSFLNWHYCCWLPDYFQRSQLLWWAFHGECLKTLSARHLSLLFLTYFSRLSPHLSGSLTKIRRSINSSHKLSELIDKKLHFRSFFYALIFCFLQDLLALYLELTTTQLPIGIIFKLIICTPK